MTTWPVAVEFFHADRHTDRNHEASLAPALRERVIIHLQVLADRLRPKCPQCSACSCFPQHVPLCERLATSHKDGEDSHPAQHNKAATVQRVVARAGGSERHMSLPATYSEKTSRCISCLSAPSCLSAHSCLSAPSSCLDLLLLCLFSLFLSLFRFNFPLYSFISWSYIYFILFFCFCMLFANPPLLHLLHRLLLPSFLARFFPLHLRTFIYCPAPCNSSLSSASTPLTAQSALCLSSFVWLFVCRVHLLKVLFTICLQFVVQLFVYSWFVYNLFSSICLQFICLQFICLQFILKFYLFTVDLFRVCLQFVYSLFVYSLLFCSIYL